MFVMFSKKIINLDQQIQFVSKSHAKTDAVKGHSGAVGRVFVLDHIKEYLRIEPGIL